MYSADNSQEGFFFFSPPQRELFQQVNKTIMKKNSWKFNMNG